MPLLTTRAGASISAFGFGKKGGVSFPAFTAGNQSVNSLYDLAGSIGSHTSAVSPTTGGTLTVNSLSLGSYDYTVKVGPQTVSSFTDGTWFTTTADTRSAFIGVNGNLTIDAGVTFVPTNRKLFTCIYVKGNLVVNGTLSMTRRGANHSATTKQNIRIINGTYGGVTNPEVPSNGGNGGAGGVNRANGTNGSAGTAGGTGGGGGGGATNGYGSGNPGGKEGSAGTSFSGGTGGGGKGQDWYQDLYVAATAGTANGGKGGNGAGGGGDTNRAGHGGSGNPGGDAGGGAGLSGQSGTGGVLIIFVEGTISGSGTIAANGAPGEAGNVSGIIAAGGGASGGGSLTVLCASGSGPTLQANGGTYTVTSGTLQSEIGGYGGAGTARLLTGLPA